MSLYKYFKPKSSNSSVTSSSNAAATVLPSPDGPLSKLVPSSTIQAANNAVQKFVSDDSHCHPSGNGKRGSYAFYTDKERAAIGNYAVQHGTATAIKHFATKHPELKWSTINDWKRRSSELLNRTEKKLTR